MSKAKNKYIELDNCGNPVLKEAENRTTKQLHKPFKNLDGYKFISNHLIELKIKNKIKVVAIFRLVPEGLDGALYKKRVQVQKNNLDRVPDLIITVYINEGNVIFISSSSIKSIIDLPKNVTTLFRLDIRFIQKAFDEEILITRVRSRGYLSEIKISRNFDLLFSDGVEPFNINEEIFLENDPFADFDNLLLNDSIVDEEKEVDEEMNKEIGYLAEKIVFNELQNKKSEIYDEFQKQISFDELEWMNENHETFNPFDLILYNKEKKLKFYIEVKGSKNNNNNFIYTYNENNFRLKKIDFYFLIKLNGVSIKKSSFDNFKIYSGEQINSLTLKTINYLVNESEKK